MRELPEVPEQTFREWWRERARVRSSARVRSALGDAPAVPDVPRDYHGPGTAAADVDLFCERVADYKANVHRVRRRRRGPRSSAEMLRGGTAPERRRRS